LLYQINHLPIRTHRIWLDNRIIPRILAKDC
jgi:hypothetical protein